MLNQIKANVTVMVEIPCVSTWSSDTTVDQVLKQALDDFNNTIETINKDHGVISIRVVGKPEIQMVVMTPKPVH